MHDTGSGVAFVVLGVLGLDDGRFSFPNLSLGGSCFEHMRSLRIANNESLPQDVFHWWVESVNLTALSDEWHFGSSN